MAFQLKVFDGKKSRRTFVLKADEAVNMDISHFDNFFA